MFLKKGESELFFVHIPRSRGRYISYLFKDLNLPDLEKKQMKILLQLQHGSQYIN